MTATTDRPVARGAAHACPGRCNTTWRKAWRDYALAANEYDRFMVDWVALDDDQRPAQPPARPAEPTIVPVAGDPTWCARCVASIGAALAQLDDLAAVLEAENTGHRDGRRTTEKVTASRGTPSPSPSVDLADELLGALFALEDYWRTTRGYPSRPPRGRGAYARTACVGWLLGQLGGILAQPDSVRFGLDVFAWRSRLHAATASAPEARVDGRCPRCSMKSLFQRDDTYVQCRGCSQVLSPRQHDDLVAEQEHVAGARKVIPTADTGK